MKIIKNNTKLIIAFILGLVLSGVTVYATGLLTSSEVNVNNTRMQLKNANNSDVTNVQEAIEALDRKADTMYTPVTLGDDIICVRAIKLHTETCSYTSGSDYCRGDGYYASGSKGTTTITYGNSSIKSGSLKAGDAFDCDVNGNGYFDTDTNGNSTERFYYVSPYFNTDTKTFDDTTGYAVLIYYRNYKDGSPSDAGVAYYASADENWYGPTTAISSLPSTTGTGAWRDDLLKTTSRAILSENGSTHNYTRTSGGTLPTSFSYSGYAARLLTAQELMRGCNLTQVGSSTTGELSNCNFIFEETKYAKNSSSLTTGPWLETPYPSSDQTALYLYASTRYVFRNFTTTTTIGARPVIDILYSKISY